MAPLVNEDALKAYEALERVVSRVMQPTNDNLKTLTAEVRDMKSQLSDKYYDKTTIDLMVGQLRQELADFKQRGIQIMGGAVALTAIIGFAVQHIH